MAVHVRLVSAEDEPPHADLYGQQEGLQNAHKGDEVFAHDKDGRPCVFVVVNRRWDLTHDLGVDHAVLEITLKHKEFSL